MKKRQLTQVSFIAIVVAMNVTHARAQVRSLDHEDVLRLAQQMHPNAELANAAAALADANALQAGLYPNPSVGWDREAFVGENAEREEAIAASVPIDLSSRRAMGEKLAIAGGAAAQVQALQTKSAGVSRALTLFYSLLAERERVATLERAEATLIEVARVAQRRANEGQAAVYEASRLTMEAELVRSNLLQARMEVERLHVVLATWIGRTGAEVRFVGDLRTPDKRAQSVSQQHRVRPSLAVAQNASQVVRDAGASDWAWFPLLNVRGGVRFGHEVQDRIGYVAGVSLALPLFSYGQGLHARARALEQRSRAQEETLQREYDLAVAQSQKQLAFAEAESNRFDNATRDNVEQLSRAAQARYIEGEGGLVALVDARRAATDVALRSVELAYEVRRSQIALRAAQGEFE